MNGIELMLFGGLLNVVSIVLMVWWRIILDHNIPQSKKTQALLVWVAFLIVGTTLLFLGAYKTKYVL